MELQGNYISFDDSIIMNMFDEAQARDNKSDVMGIPGILSTSIILGLMTLITIIGKNRVYSNSP